MDTFNQICESIIIESKKSVDSSLHEFVEKRKAGAKKIETQTREKGGPSTLTAIHFAAKQTPYKEALTHIKRGDSDKFLNEKVDSLIKQLKSWKKMNQREFQVIMGKIEAYGEVAIQGSKE